MDPIQDKVVIITGASSGLGRATAKLLAKRGAKLMLAARREDRLKELCAEIEQSGGVAHYEVTDVTDRKQVEALAERTRATYDRIDVLVNNAGLMPLAPLAELEVDNWEKMVDVNLKGVLYGLAAVLPQMKKQKRGHIINMSSVAGQKVMPTGAVYCATKFAVRALSEGIRAESDGSIRSTNISPGAVATELTDSITHEDSQKNAKQLYEVAIEPDAVARAIVFAIEQPPEVDINEVTVRPAKQAM